MYTVYMHKNIINGKVYIGITSKNPKYRWRNGEGYKANKPFYNAIKKYGWDKFDHIILADGLNAELAQKLERNYISVFMSNNPLYGYNLTDGGFGYNGFNDNYKQELPKYDSLKSSELCMSLLDKLFECAIGKNVITETTRYFSDDKLIKEIEKTTKTEPDFYAIKAILDNYSDVPELQEKIQELRKAIAKDNAFDLEI